MKPTDVREPDYFHKAVDRQWAGPAHTPVPEYNRRNEKGRHGVGPGRHHSRTVREKSVEP